MREIQTDRGRYMDRDVWDVEERKDRVVRRTNNRVKEDEEDERKMRFLFLSRAFITCMEFILVVSPYLSFFLALLSFLCVSPSPVLHNLTLQVLMLICFMSKRSSNDSPHKGHFINTAQGEKSVIQSLLWLCHQGYLGLSSEAKDLLLKDHF